MLTSDRNQSIDLQRKSIIWFLYDENIGLNTFQVSVVFHIETSRLICIPNKIQIKLLVSI